MRFSKLVARRSNLLLNIRKKAHEARALHCCFYRALLLGGEAGALTTHDAAVRIDELLEKIDIFVVDVSDVILGKNVGHVRDS